VPPVTTTTTAPPTTTTTAVPTLIDLVRFEANRKLGRIFLQWETASEVDNMVFNIYRAESAEGEYTKINGALIPAEGSATEGANYQYIDKTAKAGKTYYYKLEDVDNAGNSTFHGPVSVAARFLLKGKGKGH
jgi:fibronectin type 3 domain-containing protein